MRSAFRCRSLADTASPDPAQPPAPRPEVSAAGKLQVIRRCPSCSTCLGPMWNPLLHRRCGIRLRDWPNCRLNSSPNPQKILDSIFYIRLCSMMLTTNQEWLSRSVRSPLWRPFCVQSQTRADPCIAHPPGQIFGGGLGQSITADIHVGGRWGV